MGRKTYKNIIVADELLQQVNPMNLRMMERFLKEKNIRSSDQTIIGYRSDLNIFWVWNLLYNDNKFFTNIKKIEFSDFFAFVSGPEMKWGSARFSRVRSALSSFSNFIEKYFDSDYPAFRNVILKSVENMPKVAKREKSIFSEFQINDLLKHLVEVGKKQEACWLALAAASGARFSELFRIDINSIDESNTAFDGLFLETTNMVKTKGRGKDGKKMYKYIIKDLFIPYYKEWLSERNNILQENNKDHNAIFIKQNGDPAGDSTVRSWIEYFESYLKVPFYPHALRHFFVTNLSRIGLSQDLIIEVTGWSSGGEMYKLYCDLTAKDREWKELDKLKEHLNNK